MKLTRDSQEFPALAAETSFHSHSRARPLWKQHASASSSPLQKLLENLPRPSSASGQAKFSEWYRSLKGEKDPEIFCLQLLRLGRELKQNREENAAGAIFQALSREEVPADIRKAANEEFQAMSGQGPMALRVEYLVSRGLQDAADTKAILPMFAGSLLYPLARGSFLNFLTRSARDGLWTRGLGARFLSSLVGTLAEIPTFGLLSRGMHRLAGEAVRESVWEDLASAGITLSTLKLFSFAGKTVGSGPVLSQAFSFFGFLAAHQLEEHWQLRTPVDGATTVTDILSSMITLGLGAHLAGKALGPGFAALQRELELRTHHVGENTRPAAGPSLALATSTGNRSSLGGGLELARRADPASSVSGPNDAVWRIQKSGGQASGDASDTFTASLQQRAEILPPSAIAEVQRRLEQEWARWEGKAGLEESTLRNIEALLPHYVRYSLAALGRETPTHLNFVREVFEVALEACHATAPEINWGDADRIHFNRFLSTQEGRRDAGVGREGSRIAALRLPGLSFENARRVLQDVYPHWERFLQTQVDQIRCTPLERAQIYQRGRSLMHFYASYIYNSHLASLSQGNEEFDPSNPQVIYQLKWIEQTLEDASRHPYPAETLAILERFFREELRVDVAHHLVPEAAPASPPAELSLQALELAPLRYLRVPTAEGLGACLTQLGLSRSFFPPDWKPKGSTLFSYGTQTDTEGRLKPPGNILDLHAAVQLVNAEHGRAIDPFDAIRASMPQQLAHLNPDAEGRIVIRYTQLMFGLSYVHFGLGSLLQAYKYEALLATDADVAHQVKKSAGTVGDYRRGTTKKMQISGLEPLAKGLAGDDPASEAQMLSLLYFLRYRAYFDANMAIEDADGNPLNSTPAHPSQYRVVLVPHDVQLRPLDLTRRIRFEREPFASAINGTVDLALRLLENRCGEFAMLDGGPLNLADGPLTLTDLQHRIERLRDQHGEYFQLLSQHERNPGVVRPGQLREIQDFYRGLFRFFEAVHLYARPEGELTLGTAMVSFEIVPMTAEQPCGVRIRPHPQNSEQQRAYVVAADLLESARQASPVERGIFLRMRVMCAFLRSLNLMVEDPIYERENRRLLQVAMAANRIEASEAMVNEFFRLERLSELVGVRLDYTTEAILHRVTRGHLSDTARVRRVRHWEQDLEAFVLHRSLGSGAAEALAQVFHAYLEFVPQPFRGFSPTRLQEALAPVAIRFSESFAAEIAGHCRDFMQSVGLPLEDATPVPAIPLSVQGLAEIALAGYLHHCRSLHPLGAAGRVVPDPALMERVVDERLLDFPHLIPQRDSILRELERLLTDYNRRPSLLRVYELNDETLSANRNWQYRLLPLVYAQVQESAREANPDIAEQLSPALLNGVVGELAPILSAGSEPQRSDLESAIERVAQRLGEWGVEIPPRALEVLPEFLTGVVGEIARCVQSLDRLSSLLPNFVEAYRARSGLVPMEQMGIQAQEIYRRYFRRSLLQADPPELQEVILEVVGRPVDPYSRFREDVVREMTTLFFMGLSFLRNQYDQIGTALELSAAELHRNENQFRQNFLDLAMTGEPGIQGREDLETRIADYERFLSFFPFAPTPNLGSRIAEILAGINAPAFDIKKILSVPVPGEWTKTHPELSLVDAASLGETLQQYGRDIPLLTRPEGRALLQLVAYWCHFQEFFTVAQNGNIAEHILEIQTAPSESDADALTRQIFSQYGEIQSETFARLPALERLRCHPLFRSGEDLMTTGELGLALVSGMVKAQLPVRVEKRFWEICLEGQTGFRQIQASDPELVPGNLLAAQKQTTLAFYGQLASLASTHLETIAGSPRFEYVSAEGKPLDPQNVAPALRDRLEMEIPEVLISDEPGLDDYLNYPKYRALHDDALPPAEGYLLERVFNFVSDENVIAVPSREKFEALYALKGLLADHGLDPGLAAARLTEPMLALYREHRAEIQRAFMDQYGMNILLHILPEIRNQETRLLNTTSLEISVLPPGNMEGFPLAKVLHVLTGLPLPPEKRREVDQAIWNFEPPDPAALHADPFAVFLTEFQNRLGRYHLKNREELLKLSRAGGELVSGSSRRSSEEWLAELWELTGLPESTRTALEETVPANGRASLARLRNGENQVIVEYDLDVNTPTLLRGTAILSAKQKKTLEAARQLRNPYPIAHPGKEVIRPDENISFQPANSLTAYGIALTVLSSWPVNAFKGNFSIADKTVFAKVAKLGRQADSLLFLGADPEWVVAQYEARLFQLYSTVRESIVPQIDFLTPVSGLPEVAEVPLHVIGQQAKDPVGWLQWRNYLNMELFFRVQAVMSNAVRQNPDLEPLARAIMLGDGPTRGEGTRASPLRVKSLDHPLAVAREYLRNQSKILPYLGPWPEAPIYADSVEEVANYPEILTAQVGDEVSVREYFQRTGDQVSDATIEMVHGRDGVLLRVISRIRELERLGHRDFAQAFKRMMHENETSGLSDDEQRERAVEWYRSQRDAIIQRLK